MATPAASRRIYQFTYQFTGLPLSAHHRQAPIAAALAIVTTVGVALGLVVTNPSLEDYEVHAGEQLVAYLSDELCQGAGLPMVLQLWIRDCPGLVASQQAALAALAVRFTSRRNFGVASLYTTSIGGQPLLRGVTLPEAEMLTLGVAGQFVLVRTETDTSSFE